MARKINYIDPVDSVQGLLGSKQDLRYATANNKGYYSPAGKLNAAKNYQTRMIGMVRTRTGAKYYAVRKKSSFNANPATLHACALMAGARLVANWWLRDLAFVSWAQVYWKKHVLEHQYRTFYQWAFNEAYWRLAAGEGQWIFDDDGTARNLGSNPWQVNPSEQDLAAVPENMWVKFWSELTPNGCYIYVNGKQCPFIQGWNLDTLMLYEYVNIMSITLDERSEDSYVKCGDYWLVLRDGTYVASYTVLAANTRLFFTVQFPPRH